MHPTNDLIEFYDGNNRIAHVHSSIVPAVGSMVSIRSQTFKVVRVTYALDRADGMASEKIMRANVDLKAA